MAETKIEWADYTLNPWVGCTKVSPACDHCYAETWAKRTGQSSLWAGERRRTTAANWRLPHKWDSAALTAGRRARVFCASLADVFDNQVPPEWRDDLWSVIETTPNLDWLLLTKRPQNIRKMLPDRWDGHARDNVWLGTTAENQAELRKRIGHLLTVPAPVRFLSCEPMLGPLSLSDAGAVIWEAGGWYDDGGEPAYCEASVDGSASISWVICGGESGGGAREMDSDWARSLRDQCRTARVPFFMKQMSRKRAIPEDLLIRQFPPPDL